MLCISLYSWVFFFFLLLLSLTRFVFAIHSLLYSFSKHLSFHLGLMKVLCLRYVRVDKNSWLSSQSPMTLLCVDIVCPREQIPVWLNNTRNTSTVGQSKAVSTSTVVFVNIRLSQGQLCSFWDFSVSITHFHIGDIPASLNWSQNQWAITVFFQYPP